MKNALKRGFTLVELLVVVLIIGILSSVALPQYTKAVKKAKGVKMITAAKALADAMNMAYLEDGRYRREYMDYGGFDRSGDDFDIDIPAFPAKGDFFSLQAWPEGSSRATVRIMVYCTRSSSDPHSCSDWTYHENPTLYYNLSNGKIASITCEGSECSSYFPGTMLSSQ